MPDDQQLLREFAETHSEAAFAKLVTRHVNLVYSAALRFSGQSQLAEEITQAVFVILACKVKSLGGNVVLSGWLYQTARLTAANVVKGEIRRQRREQEAYMQSTLNEPDAIAAWEQIAPLLDDAMGRLGETDRNAVVLRFFENKTAREVAAALQLTEAAAHKRVSRALKKLRAYFFKRGVDSTAATIAETISANSVQAAPVALAKSVTAMALAKGTTASASTLTLIKGALKIMAWTKAKTAIVIGVGVLLAAGATTVAIKTFSRPSIEDVFEHYDNDKYLAKAPPVVILRPSRYANQGSWINGLGEPPQRFLGRGRSFDWVLSDAYGHGPERMILPTNLPTGQFDYLATVPNQPKEALQAEIKKQFGLIEHPETRDTDVFLLKVSHPAPGLKTGKGGSNVEILANQGKLTLTNFKMPDVADALAGYYFHIPVIDETGLSGPYDLKLQWNGQLKGDAQLKDIESALTEQLGLELVPTNMPIEVLVVEYQDGHQIEPPLRQAAWSSVGYDTPEAAFQSGLEAMSKGDVKTYLASLTPDYQKRFRQSNANEKSLSQIAIHLQHNAAEVVAFQVIAKEALSDDEVILYVRSTRLGNAKVTMKKINGEWKMDEEPH